MANAHAGIPPQYQQPLWGALDPVLKRCFIASGVLGLIVLIAVFVAPALPPKLNTLEEMPDRLARLILEKPKAPAGELADRIAKLEAPKAETKAEEKPAPKPKAEPRRRTSPPRVAADRGAEGRAKAKTEVAQNLAQVTSSVDKVMESVSKSLPASTKAADTETAPRRRRAVRSGRSGTQIASVGGASNLASPDMSGSAIEGKGISIAAITDLAVDGGGGSGDDFAAPGGGGSGEAGSSRNDYRSNESLLAVVRRYAPGIQFCYDNELKRNPGLRGKLVVSITVLANGAVSEAEIVDDRLGSPSVTQCVLAQIKGWRFPAIPSGTTSFKTPFVFTPPN